MSVPVVKPGQAKQPASPQARAAVTKARKRAEAAALEKANAQRLAQIVNLHIAGHSLSEIGASIGASADEVDRLLQRDAARYVRSQPALRVYVRNWVSERYAKMLEADYTQATDPAHPTKLEHQDRVLRILDRMTKLHGAEAPTQAEVKVEAAPEAVEKLVAALSAQGGYGYDDSIFDGDVLDGEVVHEAVEQSEAATISAGEAVGEDQPGDEEWSTDE